MVFQKSFDYGSNGYQIPKMARFPRSARSKRSPPKKMEVNHMDPFDLLATVAGELLAKRDSDCPSYDATENTSPINKIKQEQFDNGSPSKSDVFDQGSCDESSFVARIGSHGQAPINFDERLSSLEERISASSLALANGDASDKVAFTECLSKNIIGIHNLENPMVLDSKATALFSSDSSIEIPPIGDSCCAGKRSFPSIRDGIELLVDRDDDENSSTRTHCINMYSMAFKPHCTGDNRVKKMISSKYWKSGREAMNERLWNDDEEKKSGFHNQKLCYTRQRTKRSSFKRRKLYERSSFSVSNGGLCSQGKPNPLVKNGIKIDSTEPGEDLCGAHGRPSSTTAHASSYDSVENHVKLSIKSFRVPELFIEIPSNATVGSLKRTVLEAVTAILSGGLRVGVLLKGKKIRDDNKTILQAGISNIDKLDNLGFSLEPNLTQTPPFVISSTKIHASSPPAPSQGDPMAPYLTANCCTENVHDSVCSPTNPTSSVDNDYSKALVPFHALNPEAITVVPLSNSKRTEMVQRRIRRPFTVSEVEALVQAVEKLGTGRWRDVKLRAFDNAKHRTYVDLKDKWKTLVHTARISPQQRRGEPVPQQLLDRVLLAHDYWSRQQAKSTGITEQCLHPAA